MAERIEVQRQARKKKFAAVHARVVKNLRAAGGHDWEVGRGLVVIAKERLWAAGGYGSWGDYLKRGIGIGLTRANGLRRVSVFTRKDVEELGYDKLVLVLRIWENTPGREDPAKLREYRFTVQVDGALVTMRIGDPMTIADLENALALTQGIDPAPPIPAEVARTLEEIEAHMEGTDFSAKARPRDDPRGPRIVLGVDPPDLLRMAVAVIDALGFACDVVRKGEAEPGRTAEAPVRRAAWDGVDGGVDAEGRGERARPSPAGSQPRPGLGDGIGAAERLRRSVGPGEGPARVLDAGDGGERARRVAPVDPAAWRPGRLPPPLEWESWPEPAGARGAGGRLGSPAGRSRAEPPGGRPRAGGAGTARGGSGRGARPGGTRPPGAGGNGGRGSRRSR